MVFFVFISLRHYFTLLKHGFKLKVLVKYSTKIFSLCFKVPSSIMCSSLGSGKDHAFIPYNRPNTDDYITIIIRSSYIYVVVNLYDYSVHVATHIYYSHISLHAMY